MKKEGRKPSCFFFLESERSLETMLLIEKFLLRCFFYMMLQRILNDMLQMAFNETFRVAACLTFCWQPHHVFTRLFSGWWWCKKALRRRRKLMPFIRCRKSALLNQTSSLGTSRCWTEPRKICSIEHQMQKEKHITRNVSLPHWNFYSRGED